MPIYDFECDNPKCGSNIPLSSGVSRGMEAVLSYKEYLERRDGCPCPICETGTARPVFIKAFKFNRSNQPEEMKRMVIERSREYDRKHEPDPGNPGSPLTWKGQNAIARKKGKVEVDPPKKMD